MTHFHPFYSHISHYQKGDTLAILNSVMCVFSFKNDMTSKPSNLCVINLRPMKLTESVVYMIPNMHQFTTHDYLHYFFSNEG